jgi:hypothetical protein
VRRRNFLTLVGRRGAADRRAIRRANAWSGRADTAERTAMGTMPARSHGIRRLFLESGIANTRAHDFFEREGVHAVSVVMMKSLG